MLTLTAITAARAELNAHFVRHLRIAARRVVRRVRLAFARAAESRRHRRELEFLLHADDRMLSDIGITRADVHFAFGAGRHSERLSVAQDRDRAREVSLGRSLPLVDAPSLSPALPASVVTSENIR